MPKRSVVVGALLLAMFSGQMCIRDRGGTIKRDGKEVKGVENKHPEVWLWLAALVMCIAVCMMAALSTPSLLADGVRSVSYTHLAQGTDRPRVSRMRGAPAGFPERL